MDLSFILELFGELYFKYTLGFLFYLRLNFSKVLMPFLVGTLRWNYRVSLYMGNMTDVYPPFSIKEDA